MSLLAWYTPHAATACAAGTIGTIGTIGYVLPPDPLYDFLWWDKDQADDTGGGK